MFRSIVRAAVPLAALGLALVGSAAISGAQGALSITSAKFANNGVIPELYTCKGSNLSPPLEWSAPPPGTKSLALIVEDTDVNEPQQHGFVQWVVYNLAPTARRLKEGAKRDADFPRGTRVGLNDTRRPVYSAPCPPTGTHHYEFKLYALDDKIDLPGASRAELENAMKGHVLAYGELIGLVAHHK